MKNAVSQKAFCTIIVLVIVIVTVVNFSKPALAQDAIQCTPADVNLNRNLKFINTTDDTANDIYLGTGEIYFGGTLVNTPYATNSSGNLLFRNGAAQVITQSNTILLQNTSGNRIAGAYDTNPIPSAPAVNSGHYFIVDGKIEGWQVNGLNQLCVGGICITRWNDVNAGYGESFNTDNQTLSISGNDLTISGGNTVALPGAAGSGITEIQDGDGPGGISVVNGLGPIVSLSAVGGSTGVSKIIAAPGSGLTITSLPDTTGNPTSGSGDVTVGATVYGQPFAIHSLSSVVPSLPPADFELLWDGYSLAGTFLSGGFDYHKNLNSPESCAPTFSPIPVIECGSPNACDFYTGGDFGMWLTSGMTVDEGPISGANNIALNKIGRCAVYLPKRPIVVEYEIDAFVLGISGWTKVYEGYTLNGASLAAGYTGTAGSSCMQNFVPIPIIECSSPNACDFYTGGDFAGWATQSNVDKGPVVGVGNILPDIGKCAMFIKN